VLLADKVSYAERPLLLDDRLLIDRCWRYNSPFSQIHIISAVEKHKPDVIWLNLQYTLFGSNPVSAFWGLLLPASLKRLGYPIVLLLHNYLRAVNLREMDIARTIGYPVPHILGIGMKWADGIVMKSLTKADRIFTMVKAYESQLLTEYPAANAHFIEQDLYSIPPFYPVRTTQSRLITLGYFGTYKKLELLLDAFQIVRQSIPSAELAIGGQDSPQTPGYLECLAHQYADQLHNVSFCGYINDEDIPRFLWDSNLVCLTNSVNPGSSGVLRLAAVHGRGVVVPYVDLFQSLHHDGWDGVVYYEPNNTESLAATLLGILTDPAKQMNMAITNYRKAMQSNNQFQRAHLQAFEDLVRLASQKRLEE
jgi:glycosyltransferase involved in cell wall biosynthesis